MGITRQKQSIVSGHPTDPDSLGPTRTFLKPFGISKSILDLKFVNDFLIFPYKKVKKVCLQVYRPLQYWRCNRELGHTGGIGSSVVECLTRDRRAAGSSLTGVTALWFLSKTHLS